VNCSRMQAKTAMRPASSFMRQSPSFTEEDIMHQRSRNRAWANSGRPRAHIHTYGLGSSDSLHLDPRRS
jgi:hypothetical protein